MAETETSASRDRDVDNFSRDETLVRLETETTTLNFNKAWHKYSSCDWYCCKGFKGQSSKIKVMTIDQTKCYNGGSMHFGGVASQGSLFIPASCLLSFLCLTSHVPDSNKYMQHFYIICGHQSYIRQVITVSAPQTYSVSLYRHNNKQL